MLRVAAMTGRRVNEQVTYRLNVCDMFITVSVCHHDWQTEFVMFMYTGSLSCQFAVWVYVAHWAAATTGCRQEIDWRRKGRIDWWRKINKELYLVLNDCNNTLMSNLTRKDCNLCWVQLSEWMLSHSVNMDRLHCYCTSVRATMLLMEETEIISFCYEMRWTGNNRSVVSVWSFFHFICPPVFCIYVCVCL